MRRRRVGSRTEGETGMGKKIDLAALKLVVGTLYPPPFVRKDGTPYPNMTRREPG